MYHKLKYFCFLYIILLIFFSFNTVKANHISYNDMDCIGVLWFKNNPEIASWKIKFENLTRAKLIFLYSSKKRTAALRMSIQKNGDIRGAGRWKSQTGQGRDITVNYKNKKNIMKIGALNGITFRAEGKCNINNKIKIMDKIKEFTFIIKEHSQYSMNHPDNKENILRHLKHTCHAIDPKLVTERPMPADDDGLVNLINNIIDDAPYLSNLLSITKSSAERCKNVLNNGETSTELLETTIFINSKFKKYYEENYK